MVPQKIEREDENMPWKRGENERSENRELLRRERDEEQRRVVEWYRQNSITFTW